MLILWLVSGLVALYCLYRAWQHMVCCQGHEDLWCCRLKNRRITHRGEIEGLKLQNKREALFPRARIAERPPANTYKCHSCQQSWARVDVSPCGPSDCLTCKYCCALYHSHEE